MKSNFNHTKVFLSCECTGFHQNTTLISLGAAHETTDATFYAEFGDYDYLQARRWVDSRIISNLLFHNKPGKGWCNCSTQENSTQVYGNSEFIAQCLLDWLSDIGYVEIWTDANPYAWVLFCELVGGVYSLPGNVYPKAFDLCSVLNVLGHDPLVDREALVSCHTCNTKTSVQKAVLIKECYKQVIKGVVTNA